MIPTKILMTFSQTPTTKCGEITLKFNLTNNFVTAQKGHPSISYKRSLVSSIMLVLMEFNRTS